MRAAQAVLALLVAGHWLAAAAAAATVPPRSAADGDAAIMRRLRASLHATDPIWAFSMRGWHDPMGKAHPCLWASVECDAGQRVVKLGLVNLGAFALSRTATGPNASWGPLLPELAQLGMLQELILVRYAALTWPAIPAEWLAPGAFPSLVWLSLMGRSLAAPLPDIPAGSLSCLERLDLEFRDLLTTLPASWGASPAVLPALRQLSVQAQLQGWLPASWGAGFRSLTRMDLIRQPPGSPALHGAIKTAFVPVADAVQAAVWPRLGASGPLPPEWSPSGFPKLETMGLTGLDLSGSLPDTWQEGGFGSLLSLRIEYCGLTGTLPPQLFRRHGRLRSLWLEGNRFSGTLPASWAASQKAMVIRLANNLLSGAAFPPAWTATGALPKLRMFDVSGNRQMTGALPANLSWPLISLRVRGTGVEASVPEAWCSAPLASTLNELWVDGSLTSSALPACARRSFANYPHIVSGSAASPHVAAVGWSDSLPVISSAVLGFVAVCVAAAGMAGRELWRRRRVKWGTPPAALWPAHVGAGSRQERIAALLTNGRNADGCYSITFLQLAAASHCAELAGRTGQHRQLAEQHHFLPMPSANVSISDSITRSSKPQDSGVPWGAPTDSLQLQADELQFQAGPDGKLVVLGEGSHAVVYEARLSGMPVAAKVADLLPGMDFQRLWGEVAMMRRSMHERIVPLLGVAIRGNLFIVATQLMKGGTLRAALHDPDTCEWLRWEAGGRQVALDVAEGLDFLHNEAGVQHNDLKSSNVMLTSGLRACIGDLGLAQVAYSQARTMVGCTYSHAAPEQLLGNRCTMAVDVYSFGVILIELTTGSALVDRKKTRLPRAPDECSQVVLDLIAQCTSDDPACRPGAAEVLRQLRADAANTEHELAAYT